MQKIKGSKRKHRKTATEPANAAYKKSRISDPEKYLVS
jgi:hypothetical protein